MTSGFDDGVSNIVERDISDVQYHVIQVRIGSLVAKFVEGRGSVI